MTQFERTELTVSPPTEEDLRSLEERREEAIKIHDGLKAWHTFGETHGLNTFTLVFDSSTPGFAEEVAPLKATPRWNDLTSVVFIRQLLLSTEGRPAGTFGASNTGELIIVPLVHDYSPAQALHAAFDNSRQNRGCSGLAFALNSSFSFQSPNNEIPVREVQRAINISIGSIRSQIVTAGLKVPPIS
jgi:hypothetical protein